MLRHSDTFINPIKILLKAGADPNIKQKDGDTPLLVWMKHRPSKEKSLYAVELLLKAGADPNIPDKDGNTALHLMKDWHWSRTGLFDLLIDFGADITTENNEGETPLQVAEKQYERIREPKSLRKLRDLLRNPRAHKAKPVLLLTDAAKEEKIEDIKVLIDAGVDINAVDYKGNTALHSAVDYFQGNPETIELLIKLGADKNKKDREGITPFEKFQYVVYKPEAYREILNLLKPSNSNNSAKSKGGSKKRRKRKTTKRKTTKKKTTKRKSKK